VIQTQDDEADEFWNIHGTDETCFLHFNRETSRKEPAWI